MFASISICSYGQARFKQPVYDAVHSGVPLYYRLWGHRIPLLCIWATVGRFRSKTRRRLIEKIELKDLDATASFQGNWQTDSMETYSSDNKGDLFSYTFTGMGLKLYGLARPDGGYAKVCIRDQKGNTIIESIVDMYCLYPTETLKFVSPALPKDTYTIVVNVMGERGNWSDKRRSNYGSTGYGVALKSIAVQP